MNASNKKAYLITILLTAVFTLLTTGFYTYALLYDYSARLGHFGTGVFSSVFLPLLYMLATVVFFVFGFLFRSSLAEYKIHVTLPSMFASGFAALTTAAFLGSFAVTFFEGKHAPLSTVFGLLVLVLGALTAVYFVLSALPAAPASRVSLFGILAVLFCLAYVFYVYFDPSLALNSPIKILDQITFILLMLFFLAEGRMRFGAIRAGTYLPVAMTAALFTGAGSLGGLVYAAVIDRPLYDSMMHDFFLFGAFLYVLARLISLPLSPVAAERPVEAVESATSFESDVSASFESTTPDYAQEEFDFNRPDGKEEETSPKTDEEA